MNQIEIGKFIAECRKSKNMTQNQLAKMLNITNKSISKWERAEAMINIAHPDFREELKEQFKARFNAEF